MHIRDAKYDITGKELRKFEKLQRGSRPLHVITHFLCFRRIFGHELARARTVTHPALAIGNTGKENSPAREHKSRLLVQEFLGIALAILFCCGAPIEPAAADRVTVSVVLKVDELDLVTAGAASVVVSATGSAIGADSVARTRTTARASEAFATPGGRSSTGSAKATGSSTARSRDGTVATASGNRVSVQGYDGGGAGIRLVTNARATGHRVSAWSDTRTAARDGTRRDVASGVARSHSAGESTDASAHIFFLLTGEPTSTKSWTESKNLSNGTAVTTHEHAVYVSEDGPVIRTWITIRDVDKANWSCVVAKGKMVTVYNSRRASELVGPSPKPLIGAIDVGRHFQ